MKEWKCNLNNVAHRFMMEVLYEEKSYENRWCYDECSKTVEKCSNLSVARAYISFHVDEHRKTSANTLYVNFNAKDGDHMQIYYVENRPEKVFRFAWTAYLFG